MTKSKHEIDIDLAALEKNIQEKIPDFIGPNGGSLKKLQEELLKIYGLMSEIVNGLKNSSWGKLD